MTKRPFVRIVRQNDWFGRWQNLEVHINGRHVGAVKPVSHKDFPVEYGLVKIYVKMDWCTSEELIFEMDEKNSFLPLDVECPQQPILSSIFWSKIFFRLVASRSFDFQREA